MGGFGNQYQVNLDPNRLQAYGITISQVTEAVRQGQRRGRRPPGRVRRDRIHGPRPGLREVDEGLRGHRRLGQSERHADPDQGPRATSSWGPTSAAASPSSTARARPSRPSWSCGRARTPSRSSTGSRPSSTRSSPGLPAGVKVVPVYDRSDLIHRAIGNLKATLLQILLTVSLMIFLFLWHIPSALIPVITIPVAVLLSFIPFRLLGITANIMSLGGLAIAIGALDDAAVVVVEQTHKKLEQWHKAGRPGRRPGRRHRGRQAGRAAELLRPPRHRRVLPPGADPRGPGRPPVQAAGLHQEPVDDHRGDPGHHPRSGPARPVHARQELRFPAALALPVGQRGPGRQDPERGQPPHQPLPDEDLRSGRPLVAEEEMAGHRRGRSLLVAATVPVYLQLGSEFMPPLEEGSLLYMPTTMPGISITEAQKVLQVTDRIIRRVPRGRPGPGQGRPGRHRRPTPPPSRCSRPWSR